MDTLFKVLLVPREASVLHEIQFLTGANLSTALATHVELGLLGNLDLNLPPRRSFGLKPRYDPVCDNAFFCSALSMYYEAFGVDPPTQEQMVQMASIAGQTSSFSYAMASIIAYAAGF